MLEINGAVLPIEVKSGKDYEIHRALSNILDCGEYVIPEAIVLQNGNVHRKGKILYAPIYMMAFIRKKESAPAFYSVDLSALR